MPAYPNHVHELVAMLYAAHVARDRDMERWARRELRERYGISVSFSRSHHPQQEARR